MSKGEEILDLHLRSIAKVPFVREHKFHDTRKWRFDFAIPEYKLAFEVEGGIYSGGRHNRGEGFEKDCEKYNEAARLGWRVLRFTTGMVVRGDAIATITAILNKAEI